MAKPYPAAGRVSFCPTFPRFGESVAPISDITKVERGRPYPRRVLWVVVGVGIGYAAVAALLTPLTWPAMLATVPPLALACWVAVRRPNDPPAPAPTWRRVLPWAVVLAAGVTLELATLFRTSREDYPTLSSIVSPLAGSQWWFRFVGYLIWFAVGAALVRR